MKFKIVIYFTPWFYEEEVGGERAPAKFQRYSVHTHFQVDCDDEWHPTDDQWNGFIWLDSEAFPSISMNDLPNGMEYAIGSNFVSLFEDRVHPLLLKIMSDLPIQRKAMTLRLSSSRGPLKCFLGDLDKVFKNVDSEVAHLHMYL